MIESKLLTICRTLSAWEIRRLSEFVGSPFFNKNEKAVLLFEYIRSYSPGFNNPELAMQTAFENVFPKEKFSAQKLRHIMTDLTRLVEGFLIQKKLEKEAFQTKKLLLEAYQDRGLEKPAKQIYQQLEAQLASSPLKNADYHLQNHVLSYTLAEQLEGEKIEALPHSMEELDRFWLSQKLRLLCKVVNHNQLHGTQYATPFLAELLEWLPDNLPSDTIAAKVYYHILLTLVDTENTDRYNNLIVILDRYSEEFPLEEAAEMYAFALNYCIQKLNQGEDIFLGKVFSVYKSMLIKKLLLTNGVLSEAHFRNIVTIASKNLEVTWAQTFIEEYSDLLPTENRNNLKSYHLANLNFIKGEPEKSIAGLRSVNFKDAFFNLEAMSLLLKSHYECGNFAGVEAQCKTMISYLRQNKEVTDYQKVSYTHFLQFIPYMIQFSAGKISGPDLEKELEKAPSIAERKWIIAKLTPAPTA